MKNVSFLICALLICLFCVDAAAQNVVTTTRQVSGFNAVNISGGIDLYITQGTKESVKIEAADNFQKSINTVVRNGTLEIYIEPNHKLKWMNKRKAYVTVATLTNLNASGGSDIYSQGSFKVNELKISATGGSDIKFDVMGSKIECLASGGSDLTLKGKVSMLTITATGGSDIIADDLHAVKVNAIASGGSDIKISVSSELNATANGGSDIYYRGNPARISKNSSGGSDITRKD